MKIKTKSTQELGKFGEIFKVMDKNELSDATIVEGGEILVGKAKKYGKLRGMTITKEEIIEFVKDTAPERYGDPEEKLKRGEPIEYSFEVRDTFFVRVQVSEFLQGLTAVFRCQRTEPPDFSITLLPEQVRKLVLSTKPGLILHTGGTNSGKTTTIAAELKLIADNVECIILTFENPIEYRITGRKALVKQYEIPTHVRNFEQAIKIALRSDPKVIMLGEVRTKKEIEELLDLAARGHTVISTMHVSSVEKAIEFIKSLEDKSLLTNFAENLLMLVSQRLFFFPKKGKVVPVYDLLIPDEGFRTMIREGKVKELKLAREKERVSTEFLSFRPEHFVKKLVSSGRITNEEAKKVMTEIQTKL